MTLKRRLAAVERDMQPTMAELVASLRQMQADIGCPLPGQSSADEMLEAEVMLINAQASLRHGDEEPLCRFRDFALSLHAKYGAEQ